jgi:hypothetical protein
MKTRLFLALCLAVAIGLGACEKKKDDAKSADCELISFTVDGDAWQISGTSISRVYPKTTPDADMTPVITLSAGATVSPASGLPQNFFVVAGVEYTVTAEDGKTQKKYTAKATKNL